MVLSLEMNIFRRKAYLTVSQAIFISIIGVLGGLVCSETNESTCLQRESQALLEFKAGLIDDDGVLSSWENETDCCQWEGVRCDKRMHRVVALDLSESFLRGDKISASLLELDELYHLDLSNVHFQAIQIPEFIGSLVKLQYLNLSWCNLRGMIPHSLQNLSILQFLDLSRNDIHSDLGLLSGLESLEYVDLSFTNPPEANTWGQVMDKLPREKEIHLHRCSLNPSALPTSPISHRALNISTSLRYIDLSWNKIRNWRILDALEIFSCLSHLNLCGNDLEGSIPDSLWNFRHLSYLDLSYNLFINGSIPKALENFVSLYHIDLSRNQLESSIPKGLGNLASLYHLDLSYNRLDGSIPSAFGNLTFLSHLDLSNNKLQLTEFPAQPAFISLVDLDFSKNKLGGELTHLMKLLLNSTLLEKIDLSKNALFGSLPNMSTFQYLKELRLNDNHLNESIGEESLRLPSLKFLDLSKNEFVGRLPNLSSCSSLRVLRLNDNMFNGTLTETIGSLSHLAHLNLGSNHLEGLISEAHFFNLSKLKSVDLSLNSNLTVRINSLWNPPFQLYILLLTNCRLGPHFPLWLKNQIEIVQLDISNVAIMDTIPKWFWNSTRMPTYLNMSHNQIYGTVPDLSSQPIDIMDLSSNQFSGNLPPLPVSGDEMDLSKNRFLGSINNICNATSGYIVDISDNQLSGQISSDCFSNLASFNYLNLGNNYLSGHIKGTGAQCNLFSLHLRNNSFSGYIPESLGRCHGLVALDLQENKFHGTIPGWLGESMPNLVVLGLKANKFHGSLPPSLCRLQKLQVLDISMNNISGAIPKCVYNFTALTSKSESDLSSNGLVNLTGATYDGAVFYDTYRLVWKAQSAEYTRTLWLLRVIDLSNNNFSGEIPSEITSLVELVGLNFSRNSLTGSIPRNIGQLKVLNFLDLSHNSLSGNIPPTLSQMSQLGVLNLSFNNLSGKIPWDGHMDTFTADSYFGNGGLCGPPLISKPCPEDVDMPNKPKFVDGTDTIGLGHDGDMFKTREFYISMALGFIVFFWGVFGTLYFSKRWNLAILKMFTTGDDWLYVKVRLTKRRVEWYFQNEAE